MPESEVSVLVADRYFLDSQLVASCLSAEISAFASTPAALSRAAAVEADLVLVDAGCSDDLFEHVCQVAASVGLLYDQVTWQLRERSRRLAVVLLLDRRAPAADVVDRVTAAGRDGVRDVGLTRRQDRIVPDLSRRETEVLLLMARGLRNQDIATSLAISPHTVRTHVQSVLSKLGSRSRVAAVGAARQAGLLTT